MRMIRHMSCNIAGLIRNTGKKSMKGFFTLDNGKDCTDKEARDYLAECQTKGWRLVPFGKCEGFDYQTGCPGHEVKEKHNNKEK
jgi:hypothetical protein